MTHTAPDSALAVSTPTPAWRRLPIGAEVAPEGGVHFRVWAPARHSVRVVWGDANVATPLAREPDGYFSGVVVDARVGTRYRYQLDEGDAFPDPASRWQPDGPHGPSVVIDPAAFEWSDADWLGPTTTTPVFYELHVGTFTARAPGPRRFASFTRSPSSGSHTSS
jgi:1,4-alpha-glucan branching enzyme